MTLHITRFVDRVRTAEQRQQRDILLTLREAQDLHADITKLLATMTALQQEPDQKPSNNMIQIDMDGGSF